MGISEIIASHSSPVEVLRQLGVGDLICRPEFFVLLSLFESFLKISALAKHLSLGLRVYSLFGASLSERQGLVAVSSVLGMSFLIFASVRLPPEVELVDCVDKQVIFVRCNVLVVGVEPLVRSFLKNLFSQLEHCVVIVVSALLQRLLNGGFSVGGHSSLGHDPVDLYPLGVFVKDALLQLEVLLLLSVEALDLVTLQRPIAVHSLHETHHGLRALGVEAVIVASFDRSKFSIPFSKGVLGQFWLDVVPEITNKPHSIVQLYAEGLVVDSAPGAFHRWLALFTLALLRLSLEVVEQFHPPELLVLEFKLVVVINNLHMIRPLVRADLISLEQVHRLYVLRHVEVPSAKDVVLEAVHGLVTPHFPQRQVG